MKLYIKLLVFLYAININAQNNTIFVQPITATKSYQDIFGTATLQIDDAGNDGLITNPLIIAEGLDTGLMAQAGSIGDTDISTFIRDVNDPNSLNLEDLLTGGTNLIFGDQDYDIIYVNWNNGTDFIQRNAYVLEEVIKWVNDNKTGTNKNVVLGQSMGGIIARYALRDMENNGLNHDTKLYISHDAPHQGAHIPVGILHMARHVVNEFMQTPLGNITIPVDNVGNVGLATIDDLLDAPAVNQMLLNNVDTNGTRTNTIHTNWQNELRLFGYPQLTRNIALSNASHCASGQGLVSNQELVTVTGNGGTSVLTSVLMYLFVNLDPLIGIALNDVSAALLGFLPGNSKLDVEFRANAFPSSSIARIYKGRLTYEKKLLWLVTITRTIFNKSVNSINGDKFIENYPGGITPNGLAIAEGGNDSNWFYNYDYNLNVNLNFDFIPVTSALDVGSGNATLVDLDYFNKYTAANPPIGSRAIPFVNFTTSSNQNNNLNAEHISFNRRNGDWLASELDADISNNQIFNCINFCANAAITGSKFLCTTGNYSVTSEATIANWTITDGNSLATLSNATSTTATLTQTSPTSSGYVTLLVTFGNERCGTTNATLTIWVGKPRVTNFSIIGASDNVPTNSSDQFNVNYATEAVSYDWTVSSLSSTCTDSNGFYPPGIVLPKFSNGSASYSSVTPYSTISWGNCSGTYLVNCKAVNPCGFTAYYTRIVNVYGPGAGGGGGEDPCLPSLQVYPKPVNDDDLVVNLIPPPDPCGGIPSRMAQDGKNILKVYDMLGNLVYTKTYNSLEIRINDLNLKRGHYILNVFTSSGKTNKEIIIVE